MRGATQPALSGREDEASATIPVRLCVLSPTRLYREGLTYVLAEQSGFEVVGSAPTIDALADIIDKMLINVVLYDLRTPSGLVGLRRLARHEGLSVLALGVVECEEQIIACAEAGIAGYVTDNSSIEELVVRVEDALRGRFTCPPDIAAGLLRRLSAISTLVDKTSGWGALTSRELEVAALLREGLSNKQIASRLTIQLATVKNHVHSILEKTEATSRFDVAATFHSDQRGGGAKVLRTRI